MKTTFLTLLTLILLVGCSTEENLYLEDNELIETNFIIDTNGDTRSTRTPYTECYNVYFDSAIYAAEDIQGIKQVYFRQQNWYAAPNQPANYPFHQIWCAGEPGTPGGSESENDPPTGVTFVPIGGHGG